MDRNKALLIIIISVSFAVQYSSTALQSNPHSMYFLSNVPVGQAEKEKQG